MAEIYLISTEDGSASIEKPVTVDGALTLNRDVWIWGLESRELDFGLPNRGDIAIFYKSNKDLAGVGEVWDSSNSKNLTSYFDQITTEGYSDAGSIITLVNYQEIDHGERGWIFDLLDIPDDADSPVQWIDSLPEIYKVPRERIAGSEENTRLIVERLPIDSSKFGSLSPDGDGDPQGPERGSSPSDGDDGGGLDSVDWTGPLLTQQYASRDTLQEAAKGSVQIIILLFGIMIAALSFIRRAPPQTQVIADEALSITTPLALGLIAIGIATLGSALLLTITAVRPRPFFRYLAEKQDTINSLIKNADDNEKSELLKDFSSHYHTKIQEIRKWNSIIGLCIGGTIGIAIASSTLFGYGILVQILPAYGKYWLYVFIFCIISIFISPIEYCISNDKVSDQ